ncbi:hypothetical protein BJ944DRAFT_269383 [Cunninghamella echinulata]|nr:hypothetical protein BJ944DRAFT_269383 [Cunninghamella echinulata]
MTKPVNLVRFENQVAGHDNILQYSSDDIMIIKPSKEREKLFYEQSQNHEEFLEWIPDFYGSLRESTESEIKLLNEKQDIGTFQMDTTAESSKKIDLDDEHLCLENILYGFTRPCILDLKLGYQLYEDTADEKKREKMIKNASGTTIEYYGIRISGMKVFDSVNRTYTQYSKKYGRERTKDNFIDGLFNFFYPCRYNNNNNGNNNHGNEKEGDDNASEDSEESEDFSTYYSTSIIDTTELEKVIKKPIATNKIAWIVEHYIDTLMDILEFVKEHPELQLIGSSLLMVYEGDAAAAQHVWKKMLDEDKEKDPMKQLKQLELEQQNEENDDDNENENDVKPKLCDIRLIDFGKSQWSCQRKEQDLNLIKALENTIDFLYQVIENAPSSS